MKSLFALLACLGFAAASVGCSSSAPAPVVPDASPDLGEPGSMDEPMGDPGSTTGAADGPVLGEP